jgi:hypothetical protein
MVSTKGHFLPNNQLGKSMSCKFCSVLWPLKRHASLINRSLPTSDTARHPFLYTPAPQTLPASLVSKAYTPTVWPVPFWGLHIYLPSPCSQHSPRVRSGIGLISSQFPPSTALTRTAVLTVLHQFMCIILESVAHGTAHKDPVPHNRRPVLGLLVRPC